MKRIKSDKVVKVLMKDSEAKEYSIQAEQIGLNRSDYIKAILRAKILLSSPNLGRGVDF